jgi:hypothetical protein
MKTFQEFLKSRINTISESLKLIDTINLENKTAKIYKDSDVNEFKVKFFVDGNYVGEKADYHTDDKQDAISTANSELKILKK